VHFVDTSLGVGNVFEDGLDNHAIEIIVVERQIVGVADDRDARAIVDVSLDKINGVVQEKGLQPFACHAPTNNERPRAVFLETGEELRVTSSSWFFAEFHLTGSFDSLGRYERPKHRFQGRCQAGPQAQTGTFTFGPACASMISI
jgi:hypothetical protein